MTTDHYFNLQTVRQLIREYFTPKPYDCPSNDCLFQDNATNVPIESAQYHFVPSTASVQNDHN